MSGHQITPQQAASLRRSAEAELARRHFPDFAAAVHPGLEMRNFHRTYYRVLEMFARGKIRRLIITMPPQHGKSLASTALLPAWLLGRDPSLRIAIASYNAAMAGRFNRQVCRILSSQRFFDIFPGAATKKAARGLAASSAQLETASGGGILAVGRGGTLTGNSVDVAIIDDLYKDAMEADSPVVRENCWQWYTSVVRTRLHNDSRELIVFTRWHEEDLMGRIAALEPVVELREWAQVETLPCETWLHLNFQAFKESSPNELDPREHGEPLWPARHGAAQLAARRRLDSLRFEALYQGKPSAAEGMLYGDGLRTYRTLPENIVKYSSYTDTADMGDDFLCSVCYCVDGDGYIYITDLTYSRLPMERTEAMVADMLRRNSCRTAYVESNNGGRGFARALQKALPTMAVEWFHQSANKEARILSNAATVLRTVAMPHDWAVKWPELHAHLVCYRRNFRSNRWHDAADAITGMVEMEATSGRGRIKALRFSTT